MDDIAFDRRVRMTAFDWLMAHSGPDGEPMPRTLLAAGFEIDGQRVPLVAPQGIFKPQCLSLPLSITTAPNGPYDDNFGPGVLRYRYRGTDPEHRDNRGLRELMRLRRPLVYLYGLSPGMYLPVWPVFIVADDRPSLSFMVEVDESTVMDTDQYEVRDTDIRRRYVTTVARRRIHQAAFRERVVLAYRTQCSLCRLKHSELLDAAHITPDSDETGEPVVTNGVALCKLHHAAYDRHFISISPDYIVNVRPSILEETDGPMLQHGLKGLHLKAIGVPSRVSEQPDRSRLSDRHGMTLGLWEGH